MRYFDLFAFKLFLLLTFLSTSVFAQNTGAVIGKIIDGQTKAPVEYAAVTIKNASDTSQVFGAISNEAGAFKIGNVTLGTYKLQITYVGYKSIKQIITLNPDKSSVDVGIVTLDNSGVNLNEIVIKGEKTPVSVKKDTVEFNAGSFKTRPDATTEELLKKLPGVAVDRDGNITVQGQKVSRLTVDGKDFFGSDPKTATKNLPADAIDKVQVVDSKTEESKATGVDDGQREKVLNLTIKKDKKKGWFGNASALAGNTDRYKGYLSANHFNQETQFAILAMSNNTNTANFSFEDLKSFSGGNLGNIFAPPAGGQFSINVDGRGNTNIGGSGVFDNAGKGLVTTHAGGLNYSDEWGERKNFKISSSYFGYYSNGDQTKISNAQDLSQGDILRTNENNIANSISFAHRINMRLEYKPDTLTDITFRPNVILNHNESVSSRLFGSNFDQQGKLNDGFQKFNQEKDVPALFGEFSALRRLGNNKGSVSIRLNGSYSKLSSDWLNVSDINTYSNGAHSLETINQDAEQRNTNKGYTLNANYSRLLSKPWSANVGYSYNETNNFANQLTYDYNPITDRYETLVPSLTNRFNYTNWNQSARIGFVYNKKAWNINFGGAVQQSGLSGNTIANNQDMTLLKRDYWNLLPRFSVNYKPKNNRSVQLNYNSNIFLPSANDLQPVQNNTNPLYQREGNPDLLPRKNHRLTMNFNTFKPGTDIYWNGYFAYNLAFDAVSNNTRIENGVQYVKPINVDGNYSIYTGTYFGMPTKVKGLRYNLGLGYYTEQSKNYINNSKNLTNRYSIGPNASLNFDIEDKLNLTLEGSVDFNKVNNTAQQATDSKYFDLNSSFLMSWEFVKGLRIEADLNHYGYAGRSDGFNQNYFILNAGLVKYFMNRRINVALRGFDILKQNTNIDRTVNNTRIEDIQYNNLTRYFSLALTYRLAKVGANGEKNHPRNVVN